ncbi:MAG: hypothetical protein DIU79_00795 [Actinobacteria bacterium]|nr:MAG: hypothetical protein DIU79_00795 [Actinomycetota bacterium]
MQPTQRGWLTRLARVNPTAAFLGALVLVLAGFFAPGILGGGLLLALAAALIALLAVTWEVQAPRTRAARLVVLGLLITVALVKIFS